MIKGDESIRNNASNKINQQKITRPLSLKKIRDDYLRDSQPREDYRRETPRETQPRYESLRSHKQGQASLLYPSQNPVDGLRSEQAAANTAQQMYYQETSHLSVSDGDNTNILNWQDALTRSANKPDLAAKLIIMMLDTINDEKQALTQAWEARDRSTLAQIAHRILGGSRYTGVPQLRQASQNLEDKCLLNVQHTTPAQFAMLAPYYEALLTALNNLQTLDLSAYPQLNYHRLSENDMTWKMI
ncbi:MAG: Hpt domain-containing protein [Psychrobacter sp.]|nr:Hpt domain-containing protein [Psychrobacter sp.]